jgi:type VI secretion system protein ImpM
VGLVKGRPPSCYGKLPARADFIARRLPRATLEVWDPWLQACLEQSRQALGAAWQDLFLTAPPWRLVLPAGACGQAALIGVLVPSMDAVGRCFPFLVAQEVPAAADPVGLALAGERWLRAAETLAMRALDDDFDLAALELPLPPVPIPAAAIPHGNPATRPAAGSWTDLDGHALPAAALGRATPGGGQPSLWWTGGGARFSASLAVTAGMVAPRGFAALLDGDATRHGWTRTAGAAAPPEADAAWDRDE